MTKRVLHIKIQSLQAALAHAGEVMKRVEAGNAVTAYEGIGFEAMEKFLAVFTPRRWVLIETLKQAGPLSIYALAKRLGRNYKNVHGDVKVLMDWMIIEHDAEGRVHVPYDEIEACLPLGGQVARKLERDA